MTSAATATTSPAGERRMGAARTALLLLLCLFAFLPGICIAVTALGFTLFGEALREAMDPRTRAR